MPFALREHTADVAVEAWGQDLDEVFAALADGTAAAGCEAVPAGGDRFDVSVTAESLEAALFDYLDELIYQRDVRGVLPVDNRATVERRGDSWVVSGSARGVDVSRIDGREIKAVTYSDMTVEERGERWYAHVVLDV